MNDIKIDMDKGSSSFGDLYLEGGDCVLINDTNNLLDIVRQRCILTLETQQGEFYLDEDFGIPWRSYMVKNADEFMLEVDIKLALKALTGVKNVSSIDINKDDELRTLKYQFVVDTVEGQTGL